MPEAYAHPADGITIDEPAMGEFLAAGVRAATSWQVQSQLRVLVVGAGSIGMDNVPFAALRGAEVTTFNGPGDRLSSATGQTAHLDRTDFTKRLKPISKRVRTLTYNDSKEFADHTAIDRDLRSTTYFAERYLSW